MNLGWLIDENWGTHDKPVKMNYRNVIETTGILDFVSSF